jgi:hypothetical protein
MESTVRVLGSPQPIIQVIETFKDLLSGLLAPARPTIQVNEVIKGTNRELVAYKWSRTVSSVDTLAPFLANDAHVDHSVNACI